jgi:4-amino-4-deoxy-L-arabinose transferase-like glycosyltransferase
LGSVALSARRRVATLPGAASSAWLAAGGIAAVAAALRLPGIGGMRENFFYDAGVRSMSLSWHNFFVGAFDPSASLAVDKPPIDLWLQVGSVKLLGFNRVALSLPQALAGSVAVLIAYDLGRRLFGSAAGLCAAAALAVLPVSVVTSRSDTMDSLMMALALLAAWLVVRAVETGRARWLYLAALVLGIDFNVKLLEALVPLPAIALLYVIAAREPVGARMARLGAGLVVLVAASLSWAAAVSTLAVRNRPYPIGSTNGSVWNVLFVYNGIDRIRPPTGTRVHAAAPPGLSRLFSAIFSDYIGVELLPALVAGALGLVAAAVVVWARREGTRLSTGGAAMVAVWLLTGFVLFSRMGAVRLRYLEAMTPAVALALGAGTAALARQRPVPAAPALGAIALVGAVYASHIPVAGAVVALAVIAAVAATLLLLLRRPSAAVVAAMVAVLAAPTAFAAKQAAEHSSDAPVGGGGLTARSAAKIDRYARAHRHGARYLLAAAAPGKAAALMARPSADALPHQLPWTPFRQRPRARSARAEGRRAHGCDGSQVHAEHSGGLRFGGAMGAPPRRRRVESSAPEKARPDLRSGTADQCCAACTPANPHEPLRFQG